MSGVQYPEVSSTGWRFAARRWHAARVSAEELPVLVPSSGSQVSRAGPGASQRVRRRLLEAEPAPAGSSCNCGEPDTPRCYAGPRRPRRRPPLRRQLAIFQDSNCVSRRCWVRRARGGSQHGSGQSRC